MRKALEGAKTAQEEAEKAIKKAEEDIEDAQGDLTMVNTLELLSTRRSFVVWRSLMVRWVIGSILHGELIELFLVPASTLRLVWYVLSCRGDLTMVNTLELLSTQRSKM